MEGARVDGFQGQVFGCLYGRLRGRISVRESKSEEKNILDVVP